MRKLQILVPFIRYKFSSFWQLSCKWSLHISILRPAQWPRLLYCDWYSSLWSILMVGLWPVICHILAVEGTKEEGHAPSHWDLPPSLRPFPKNYIQPIITSSDVLEPVGTNLWELLLFPTLCSVPSRWKIEVSHGGNVYHGKWQCYEPRLPIISLSPKGDSLLKKNLLAATNYIPLARGIITGPHVAGRWTGKCSFYSRWLCARLMKHNYWVASNSLCQCCLPSSVSVPGNIQDSKVSYVTLYQPSSLEAANCGLSLGDESCWKMLVLQIIRRWSFFQRSFLCHLCR